MPERVQFDPDEMDAMEEAIREAQEERKQQDGLSAKAPQPRNNDQLERQRENPASSP